MWTTACRWTLLGATCWLMACAAPPTERGGPILVLQPVSLARLDDQRARVGLHWHWTLTPAWMLVSALDATRQLGTTRTSPLVVRTTGVAVSTALAYRF